MLLIRPKPIADESFIGYLFRLANANGLTYESLSLLVRSRAAPIKSYSIDDRHTIKRLFVQLTGHSNVVTLFDPWEFYLGYKKLFDYQRIKFCPYCFAESNFYRAEWHSRYKFSCEKHKRYLIDVCSSCSKEVVANSIISGSCISCGTRLEQMHSLAEKPMHFNILEVIASETSRGINMVKHKSFATGLEPFMYLADPLHFERWNKKRDASIYMLAALISESLNLLFNIDDAKAVMMRLCCNGMGLLVISNGKFSRFLRSNDCLEIKNVFKSVVDDYAAKYKDETIRLHFVSLLYNIDLNLILDEIDGSNIQLVRKQGGKVLRLGDLHSLLQRLNVKS